MQPQLVVASCGLNNDYGHPHREVIQEMQDEGIDFYRTDLYGTVTVTAPGGRQLYCADGKTAGRRAGSRRVIPGSLTLCA